MSSQSNYFTFESNGGRITLTDLQILNNENFSEMKLSELVFIVEQIMDCYYNKDEIPDKVVIKAMDIINELDDTQHNLGKPMFELTKRLRNNMKKSISHEACIKSIILPILIKSCKLWSKNDIEANIPKDVDAILSSCNDDTINYIKFVLSNLLSGIQDGSSTHKKMRNKVQKYLSLLKSEIIKQKGNNEEIASNTEYLNGAIKARLNYILSLFKKNENEENETKQKE